MEHTKVTKPKFKHDRKQKWEPRKSKNKHTDKDRKQERKVTEHDNRRVLKANSKARESKSGTQKKASSEDNQKRKWKMKENKHWRTESRNRRAKATGYIRERITRGSEHGIDGDGNRRRREGNWLISQLTSSENLFLPYRDCLLSWKKLETSRLSTETGIVKEVHRVPNGLTGCKTS